MQRDEDKLIFEEYVNQDLDDVLAPMLSNYIAVIQIGSSRAHIDGLRIVDIPYGKNTRDIVIEQYKAYKRSMRTDVAYEYGEPVEETFPEWDEFLQMFEGPDGIYCLSILEETVFYYIPNSSKYFNILKKPEDTWSTDERNKIDNEVIGALLKPINI